MLLLDAEVPQESAEIFDSTDRRWVYLLRRVDRFRSAMESLRECSCCLESDCGQLERAEIKKIGSFIFMIIDISNYELTLYPMFF